MVRGRRASRAEPKEGDHIEVYWNGDKEYYAGKITKFDPVGKTFRVEYVDGDIEDLDLTIEKWRHINQKYVETSITSGEDEDEKDEKDIVESDGGRRDVGEREKLITSEKRKSKTGSMGRHDAFRKLSLARKILPKSEGERDLQKVSKSHQRVGARNAEVDANDIRLRTAVSGEKLSAGANTPSSIVHRPATVESTAVSAGTGISSTQKEMGIGSMSLGQGSQSDNKSPRALIRQKKGGKQALAGVAGWKKQLRASASPRKSGGQSVGRKKHVSASDANGHIERSEQGSDALASPLVSGSGTHGMGSTKRGRSPGTSFDVGKGKRPRKVGGQDWDVEAAGSSEHVGMMSKMAVEASRQCIQMTVAPLHAQVLNVSKDHERLKSQAEEMQRCLQDLNKQLAKIQEACNVQSKLLGRLQEAGDAQSISMKSELSKTVTGSLAELRSYVEDTIDKAERQGKQTNSAFLLRLSSLETESMKLGCDVKSIASEVSNVPVLVADRMVASMDREREKMEIDLRAEMKKSFDESSALYERTRNGVIDLAAGKAGVFAADKVLATLPNAINAQVTAQLEKIIDGMLRERGIGSVLSPSTGTPVHMPRPTIIPASAPSVPTVPPRNVTGVGGNAVTPLMPSPVAISAAQASAKASLVATAQSPSQATVTVGGNLASGTVVPGGPTNEGTEMSKKVAFAKALVARSATIWLLEDTDRSAPPEQRNLRRDWAKECCTLCFRSVNSKLAGYADPEEAMRILNASLSMDDIDLSWFLEPINAASIEKARLNYSTWDPPLCNDEWHAEASVLKELCQRYGAAQTKTEQDANKCALQLAIAITSTAANAEE